MRTQRIFSSALLITAIGCATPAPQKTQMQIREFQTRTYATGDVKMVLKAMMHVLQDDGFLVKSANSELGLLYAAKEINVQDGGEAFFSMLLFGANARWKKNSIIEATANVSEFGTECRVRVNFQIKVLDNVGNVMDVRQIEDPNYYQTFFSKVDKGIFIQTEKL